MQSGTYSLSDTAGYARALAVAKSPSSDPAAEAIDRAKAAEIMGRDLDDDQRTRKFVELVLFPLGVCLALVMLLRRGFLS